MVHSSRSRAIPASRHTHPEAHIFLRTTPDRRRTVPTCIPRLVTLRSAQPAQTTRAPWASDACDLPDTRASQTRRDYAASGFRTVVVVSHHEERPRRNTLPGELRAVHRRQSTPLARLTCPFVRVPSSPPEEDVTLRLPSLCSASPSATVNLAGRLAIHKKQRRFHRSSDNSALSDTRRETSRITQCLTLSASPLSVLIHVPPSRQTHVHDLQARTGRTPREPDRIEHARVGEQVQS